MSERIAFNTCAAVLMASILFGVSRQLRAKEPTIPDWQLVARASCLQVGDHVDLRTNDGVTIKSVAHLRVAHVATDGVVTFVERQP